MKKEIKNWRNWVLLLFITIGMFFVLCSTCEPRENLGIISNILYMIACNIFAVACFCICAILVSRWRKQGSIRFVDWLLLDE